MALCALSLILLAAGRASAGLEDAIRTLQVMTGGLVSPAPLLEDVDGDGRLGHAEAVYPLQVAAGLRPPMACDCRPWAPPSGETVSVSTAAELAAACTLANRQGGNLTILIADGAYPLSEMLHVTADHVTFRGQSGNRDAVVLRGDGMDGVVAHIFLVAGRSFAVADLTLGWVACHGIQIQGELDADHARIRNVRFVDTGEQMLKVSVGGDGVSGDGGVVECCLFEYPAGIGPQYYIGGVDCHRGRDWIIRGNEFRHIRSPDDNLAEHAIHFWNGAQGTLVENNRIVNCDRGIGFGLGGSTHGGGLIRNNQVHTTRDVGIGLESATGAGVVHNSLFTEHYVNSIEYRFAATSGGLIANNLTNAAIAPRDGGTASLSGNFSAATAACFVNPTQGDLHLAGPFAAALDQAAPMTEAPADCDCQERPSGPAPDIGADEYAGTPRR
jgi:hypothetical protein